MAIPLLALNTQPSEAGNNFLTGYMGGQQQQLQNRALEADAAKTEAAARTAKLGQLSSMAFSIARLPVERRGAALEQARQAVGALYGNDPEVMKIVGSVTPDNIEGFASALTSIKDQLDAGKTDADIANTFNMMGNRDLSTRSGVAVDQAQIGGIANANANRNAATALDYTKASMTGYGQLPEGQVMAGDRAMTIPGYTAPPTAAAGQVITRPDGTVVVTPGKMTEGQSKDVYFLNRAQSVAGLLDQTDTALTDSAASISGGIPVVGNYLKGNDYRMAEQAGREFIASILRKETGAAVTESEMQMYGPMYLPQPGDDPAIIQRKREARRVAIQGIQAGLGSAAGAVPNSMPGTMPAPAGDVGVDALLQKYGVR